MKLKSPLTGKPLRNPGQSLDEQIQELINDKMLAFYLFPAFFWVIAGLEWFAEIKGMARMPGTYALVAGISTMWCFIQFFKLRRRVRALRQGRDGEMVVGQFLERLRASGSHVFHDVLADGFNLDHVIVSTQGIFAIETKTFSKSDANARVTFSGGQLLVAGQTPDRDPVSQAKAEAIWLSRILKESTGKEFPVRGVVLFPGWFVDPVPQEIKRDVWVLEPKAFPAWLDKELPSISISDASLAAFHLSRYIRARQ